MKSKNVLPKVTEGSLLPVPVCTGIINLPQGKNKIKAHTKGHTKPNLNRKQGEIGK